MARKVRPKKVGRVLVRAIHLAEDLFVDQPKSGPDKRKWVVEFVNERLDIPFLNENQESLVLGILVDVLVEVVFDAST
tara:strand:- start:1653 stop:1886 length:234 start_codon:yes stop_codon:yes gene_type:complete